MNYVQANPQRIPYWLEECQAAIELGHAEDARSAAVIVCRMTAEFYDAPDVNAVKVPKPFTFAKLPIGYEFDFVNDANPSFNSFYDRCRKISARKYRSLSSRLEYRVGSIHAKVYHIDSGL